jgi:hypothetical protein
MVEPFVARGLEVLGVATPSKPYLAQLSRA